MKKILLGGFVGGVLLFLWGYVTHGVVSKDGGLLTPPSNERLVSALQENLKEPGVYHFETLEPGTDPKSADAMDKLLDGPHGLVVYQPSGKYEMTKLLGIEFATDFLAAALAAFAVLGSRGGYMGRVAASTLFGVIAWLSISASYWNWYGFSWAMVQTDLLDQVGGWFVAGLVIAAIARPSSASA